ncbi:hypothetical protein [Acidovorax sp. SDU_ACID1]|uniref:hypothetical protein n=1 Tax=Acidovorax sp. SDU_ACID1 TaxID=3136632 RepID=UPI00387336EB
METKLLEATARTGHAVVVVERADIEAFLSLRAQKLIDGVLHILPTGARYATIHGLTPDGRALLAMRRCLRQRALAALAMA